MSDEKHTLVENGSELRGTMTSTCPVTVKGSLDGELEAPAVTVTATGRVQGRVRTANLQSDGVIGGEIEAQVVVLSGTVQDDTVLKAETLEVHLAADGSTGAKFGSCRLEVGDPDSDRAAVVPEQSPRAATPSAPPPAPEA